ncbi:MAG: amidohydrolase [Solobacterium sp.]|nr:amidohydrolase [Solobacterium sp.]
MDQIIQEAFALQEDLTAYRHYLHQNPELGLNLPVTSSFIRSKLDEFGIPNTFSEASNCVTAVLGQGEKCIMLRADMDALPIKEDTGEPFSSNNEYMHACGHDLHAAALLGAARLLKAHESELKGKVKLLFQAGEETFTGADAALKDGVLENPHVDVGFAMHSTAVGPIGLIAYGKQPMSSCFGFKITVIGKSAHGSSPEDGIDPIAAAVHIYLAYQELLAREVPAKDEAALTIGQFNGGSAPNIIPETVEMQGTLRTFNDEVRINLINRMKEAAEYVCKAYRCKCQFDTLYDVPVVINNPEMTDCVLEAINALDAGLVTRDMVHTMGSEDFAFISQKLPTTYFAFGAGVEDVSRRRPHHNPKVVFNDKALPIGAAIYTKVAMHWLEKNA